MTLLQLFDTLGNPRRLRLVLLLEKGGEVTAQEVAGAVGQDVGVVRNLLTPLAHAGLVEYGFRGPARVGVGKPPRVYRLQADVLAWLRRSRDLVRTLEEAKSEAL
jgi:DNA-binding transcriptional ArsR family regulator